jgi:hypothetical protein
MFFALLLGVVHCSWRCSSVQSSTHGGTTSGAPVNARVSPMEATTWSMTFRGSGPRGVGGGARCDRFMAQRRAAFTPSGDFVLCRAPA